MVWPKRAADTFTAQGKWSDQILEHHSQAWDAGRWSDLGSALTGCPEKSLSSSSSSEFIRGIPAQLTDFSVEKMICDSSHRGRDNMAVKWSNWASLGKPEKAGIGRPLVQHNQDGRLEVFAVGGAKYSISGRSFQCSTPEARNLIHRTHTSSVGEHASLNNSRRNKK
jgi:hypothetical protein